MSALSEAALIATEVRSGLRSARQVCRQTLAAIERLDQAIGAFVEVLGDYAQSKATEIDAQVASGQAVGPLAGVPIAIKDNICTACGRTTCGSRMLRNYRSPYSATAVKAVEKAGAIIVGKTNLDEFGMGSSTENSAFFPTRNPWDPQRVPGGSSGGSAAAVAAGLVPVALGSDTGGSVRQPAAMCGVVGLKPTYGRVSRYGLVAYASSLDQIGVFARSVPDAAIVLGVISGPDPHDSTCARCQVPDYAAAVREADCRPVAAGVRIGVAREYFGPGLDPQVEAAVRDALVVYRDLGAELLEVSLPHTPYAIAAYYVVACAECSSNLARFDGVRYGQRAEGVLNLHELYSRSRDEGLGPEVKRRIMLGTFVLSSGYYEAYYEQALRVRRLIWQDFQRAFEQVDFVAGPTTPTPAFRLGEKLADPLQMYLADVYTVAVNLAGLPAISLPCGLTSERLPVGMQLIGPAFEEARLLQVARAYERAACWKHRPLISV
jgi:aspartyl-tRNA(Asn)/glutamyl-tRNA(Gln) amidotransferase subunit A